MLNDYINNLESILSIIYFKTFKIITVCLVIMLILSLVFLAIGCLIKSQRIKSKCLKLVPSLMLGIIFLLFIPVVLVKIR